MDQEKDSGQLIFSHIKYGISYKQINPPFLIYIELYSG